MICGRLKETASFVDRQARRQTVMDKFNVILWDWVDSRSRALFKLFWPSRFCVSWRSLTPNSGSNRLRQPSRVREIQSLSLHHQVVLSFWLTHIQYSPIPPIIIDMASKQYIQSTLTQCPPELRTNSSIRNDPVKPGLSLSTLRQIPLRPFPELPSALQHSSIALLPRYAACSPLRPFPTSRI